MSTLSPIESEFSSTEEAEAYEHWLRTKVAASLTDPRPHLPHDAVMAEVEAILAEAEQPSQR